MGKAGFHVWMQIVEFRKNTIWRYEFIRLGNILYLPQRAARNDLRIPHIGTAASYCTHTNNKDLVGTFLRGLLTVPFSPALVQPYQTVASTV